MDRAVAVMASVDDASAMWYNPARAAFLEDHHIQLNIDNIYPYKKFTPDDPVPVSSHSLKEELGMAQFGSLYYVYGF